MIWSRGKTNVYYRVVLIVIASLDGSLSRSLHAHREYLSPYGYISSVDNIIRNAVYKGVQEYIY